MNLLIFVLLNNFQSPPPPWQYIDLIVQIIVRKSNVKGSMMMAWCCLMCSFSVVVADDAAVVDVNAYFM